MLVNRLISNCGCRNPSIVPHSRRKTMLQNTQMKFIHPILTLLATLLAAMAIAGCETQTTAVPVENREPYVGSAYDLANVDVPPRVVSQARPKYPIAFRKTGMRGLAVVEFIVDENGHTRNLVARKATDVAFAEAAKIALSQWVFLPAKKGGVPVACRMQVPMVFSITED